MRHIGSGLVQKCGAVSQSREEGFPFFLFTLFLFLLFSPFRLILTFPFPFSFLSLFLSSSGAPLDTRSVIAIFCRNCPEVREGGKGEEKGKE